MDRMKEVCAVVMPVFKLSDNEYELLGFIAAGLSNREIARRKRIKVKSCENAISRIAKKLNIHQSPTTNQRVLLAKKFESYVVEQGEELSA
jgi:DNA-binding NarL/FixJ family response regulator